MPEAVHGFISALTWPYKKSEKIYQSLKVSTYLLGIESP